MDCSSRSIFADHYILFSRLQHLSHTVYNRHPVLSYLIETPTYPMKGLLNDRRSYNSVNASSEVSRGVTHWLNGALVEEELTIWVRDLDRTCHVRVAFGGCAASSSFQPSRLFQRPAANKGDDLGLLVVRLCAVKSWNLWSSAISCGTLPYGLLSAYQLLTQISLYCI